MGVSLLLSLRNNLGLVGLLISLGNRLLRNFGDVLLGNLLGHLLLVLEIRVYLRRLLLNILGLWFVDELILRLKLVVCVLGGSWETISLRLCLMSHWLGMSKSVVLPDGIIEGVKEVGVLRCTVQVGIHWLVRVHI